MDPTPADAPPPGASGAAAAGARPRRRRKWIVLGAVLLGAVAVVVFTGGGAGNREATLTFAGFTNVDSLPHVWLWVTNGARSSTFQMGTVSHQTGKAWVLQGYRAVFSHTDVRAGPVRGDWYPAHRPCLVSMQVHEAKLPLRVGLDVREQPGALAGVKERLAAWYAVRVLGKSNYVSRVRRYSVTNEFWPER